MLEQFHKGEPLWGSSETSYSARLKKSSKKIENEELLSSFSQESVSQTTEKSAPDAELLLLWDFYANVYGV